MPDLLRSILLFGPPGVGKGTHGRALGVLPGFTHLATGDMFRGLDRESDLGQEFLKYSTQGLLVPDELTIRLWQGHVATMVEQGSYDPAADLLVLDGIPRSVAQAEALTAHIDVRGIVHLVASDPDVIVGRIRGRALKEDRPDDSDEDVIRNRFAVYEQETAPVLGCYDPALVHEVDGIGSAAEVLAAVLAAVIPMQASGGSSS